MSDWSRRQVLAGLGAAGVGLGGYWWFEGDRCPSRREPRWRLDGRYWSPPVVANGSTYVSEGHGLTGSDRPYRIASLADFDGGPEWVFTEVGAGAGVPLVADERVYVGTGRDRVYALDRRSGHVEWRYDAGGDEKYGGGAWGQPVSVSDLVAVGVSHSEKTDPDVTDSGDFTHRVVALAADSGEEVWATRTDAAVRTGPVAVGGNVVAATEAGSVYGLAAEDGTANWRTAVGSTVRRSLFADAERVLVASVDGRVAALDPGSGAKQWTATVQGAVRATERDGTSLLVGTEAGAVVALARGSGRKRWRYGGESDPAIADLTSNGSRVHVLDQRGLVRVVDAAEGEERNRFRIAENATGDRCGWTPGHHRGSGLVADENSLVATGPWVGRFPRDRE